MIRGSTAEGAIITLLDNTLWSYRAETADFGYPIDDKFVYHATMMTPPGGDSQLCSFPPFLLTEMVEKADQLKTPVALLVSLGGCDTAQKVEVAIEIHEKVTNALRFLVFYNNDPDNPDEIMSLTAPQNTAFADDMEQMSFSSVSTATGSAMLLIIQQKALKTGKTPDFFSNMNEGWNLQMFLETMANPNQNDMSNDRTQTSNFYWFRITLFTLLILSPCCRACYLWWAGGGRIRLRRNEAGRIVGFHYTPPMSYWFVSHGVQENAPTVTNRLTEEEVMALPEITYKPPPPDENDVNDEAGNSELLEDVDIAVVSGSADPEEEVKSVNQQSPSDEEQPAESAPPDENRTTTCTVCSICIDEFEAGERLRLLPRCRHAFHTDCILPWLTGRQGCCPLCKSSVLEPEEGSTSIDEESNTIQDNLNLSNDQDTSTSRASNVNVDSDAEEDDPVSQIGEDHGDVEITGNTASEIEISLAETSDASTFSEARDSPHDESTTPEPIVDQEEQDAGEPIKILSKKSLTPADNVRELVYSEISDYPDDESRIPDECERQNALNSTAAADTSHSSQIPRYPDDESSQKKFLSTDNETATDSNQTEVPEDEKVVPAIVEDQPAMEPVNKNLPNDEMDLAMYDGEATAALSPSDFPQDEVILDAARTTSSVEKQIE